MKTGKFPKTWIKRKPIRFWEAISRTGQILEQNNSITILRYKYGNSVFYATVR
jgi:hypothetical protein